MIVSSNYVIYPKIMIINHYSEVICRTSIGPGNNKIIYFDVTYTAGRRKKNADGTHSAKKAREILMIGGKNG